MMATLVAPTAPLLEPSLLMESLPKHEIFVKNPCLLAIYDSGSCVSREYEFPLHDAGFRKVEEVMLESRFSFHIPIQYLKMCLNTESQKILALKSICKLSKNWELMRQGKLEIHERCFEKYKSRLEFLERRNEAPYFKKSTCKTVENLDFVAINLHLQKMRINDKILPTMSDVAEPISVSSSEASTSAAKVSEYDVITVGAAANHSMGFKHGGLLDQLIQADDLTKRAKTLNFSTISLNRNQPASIEEHLFERISTLNSQIKGRIEELKTLLGSNYAIYMNNEVPPAEVEASLMSLQTNVGDFLNICNSEKVASTITSLAAAKLSYKPLQRTTASTSSISDLDETFHQDDDFNKSELALKKTCKSVKCKLEEVLKSFESLKNPVSPEAQITETERQLSALQVAVEDLFSTSSSAISFYVMKQDGPKINPDLTFRRNSVFSQALSLCACAVATLIAGSLHKKHVLEQFAAVGIYLQVESLLSTYGNEMGMLQDYVIGIFDLVHVTFRCVRADGNNPTEQRNNAAFSGSCFLPQLTGTITAPIVLLPFNDESFDLLPSDLQTGKLIKLFPVIFNVGINEEQTLARRIGDTMLQESINDISFEKTSEYIEMLKQWCPTFFGDANNFTQNRSVQSDPKISKKAKHKKNVPDDDHSNETVLKRLNRCIHSKKHKNVEILQLTSEVCRRVNGARVTSCKSAKDRTAMGVTLEQVRILRDNHALSPQVFVNALHCMRSEGTRPENTMKNTGNRSYAFSHFQLKTFPKLYRPPDGTYGKGET